jgi:hypothetical protein
MFRAIRIDGIIEGIVGTVGLMEARLLRGSRLIGDIRGQCFV